MAAVTLGVEEEVFVCEPEGPSANSLYYLARLMWSDPARNYARTASNFARGADVREGLMSCVEVSTGIHDSTEALMEDLAARRRALGVVADGLVVPIGALLDRETPTNVAALQVHVGVQGAVRDVAYANLAYFLPLLALVCANSPGAGARRFGQSYRQARGFATGPLGPDPTARFQDLIVSKRLGTIELRVPDPVWDLRRVRALAEAVAAIAALPKPLPYDRARYNGLRALVATEGYVDALRPLYEELGRVCPLDEALLERTAADETWEVFEALGLLPAYSALDNGWRTGTFAPRDVPAYRARAWRSALGWAGYYVPKLPYVTWKWLRER